DSRSRYSPTLATAGASQRFHRLTGRDRAVGPVSIRSLEVASSLACRVPAAPAEADQDTGEDLEMKKKVLVTRAVFDETLAYLAEHVDVTSNQADVKYSLEELAARLQGMDAAVITSSDRVDEALLARCPNVKAFCSASVGYNHIDVAACTRHGVVATNTPGVLTNSVADFAVCLTLATCRRLTEAEIFLRSGAWAGTHLKEMLGVDLHHATVGICGFGRIGQAIAQRLRGFHTKLLYTTRTRLSPEVEQRFDVAYAVKDDLLRRSDIVILILPYTSETHHYIGER